MDTLSHGIWSYLIFYRHKFVWLAVLFGVLPDLLSFGLYSVFVVVSGNFQAGPPIVSEIPDWTFTLYGITHSWIITALWISTIFLYTKVKKKTFPLPVLAYPLSIAIDVPMHTRDYLPTPFLWPLSEWRFPGFSWASLWFTVLNFSLIVIISVLLFMKNRSKSRRAKTTKKIL